MLLSLALYLPSKLSAARNLNICINAIIYKNMSIYVIIQLRNINSKEYNRQFTKQ